MVKKWIIMLSLILILVAGCIIESIYVNKSFEWLINSLESLQITITENKESIDNQEIINTSHKIHEEWHKRVKVLKCLIWHTGIKDVETGFARISVYIEENDYTEAYAEIATLIDYTAHYLDDFRISIDNIF
ncbi:MAG: DUF4363 family protein [Clostridia bacterium]|nr:DUF4363 family protein [Clostridia bacterium]